MEETLHTLTGSSEGLLKDRGSRFLAFAYPVHSQEEIDAYLQALRKQYYDARHHCYAYRLGTYGETTFANDDGEPAHSAGDPILGAIRSARLTWTLIVVVRYFGGTKLGVRGLIEAYRDAAADAIAANTLEELIPQVIFCLRYAYDQTTTINRVLHPFTLEEQKAEYTDRVARTLAMKKVDFPPLRAQLEAARLDWELLRED